MSWRSALEKFITLDPAGNRPLMGNRALAWDKQTAVRLPSLVGGRAGADRRSDVLQPSAEHTEVPEQARLPGVCRRECELSRRYLEIPRDVRGRVFYKRGQVVAKNLMANAGNAKHYLDDLALWLADKPLDLAYKGNKEDPVDIRCMN